MARTTPWSKPQFDSAVGLNAILQKQLKPLLYVTPQTVLRS